MNNYKEEDTFFEANKDKANEVLSLGILEACTYLVIAGGTGSSTSIVSFWSLGSTDDKFIGKGMHRVRHSVSNLIKYNFIKIIHKGSKPIFKRPVSYQGICCGMRIRLIKDLIETTIAKQLLEIGDIKLLDLLIDLYKKENVIDGGEINHEIYMAKFDKQVITEGSDFLIYGMNDFSEKTKNINIVAKHQTGTEGVKPFFNRLLTLKEMGFLTEVIQLIDCNNGKPIAELNNELINDALLISMSIIENDEKIIKTLDTHDYVIPVSKKIKDFMLIKTYRTKHTSQEISSKDWFQERSALQSSFKNKLQSIVTS